MSSDESKTLTTWGYARLSQRGRDESIEEMLETIRSYCRSCDRLQLETTLNDGEMQSGYDGGRKEYRRLRSAVDDERIDAVVV